MVTHLNSTSDVNLIDQLPNQTVKKEVNDDCHDSPFTPQSVPQDNELDPYEGLFDNEQSKILTINQRTVEDPSGNDIGRHVKRLRKHPLDEVRNLVKQLLTKFAHESSEEQPMKVVVAGDE